MGSRLRRCAKFLVPAGILELYHQRGGRTPQEPNADAAGAEPRLPARDLAALLPGIERVDVSIQASQLTDRHHWTLPIRELLILGAICSYARPLRIFEFGTFTGCSTLAMAMNSPGDTEIVTLDLNPDDLGSRRFTVGEAYQNTPFEKRIRQLLGNSLTLDYRPYCGSVDFVFIDANHGYSFVKADSDHAFQMLRRGGIIVWDDYLWDENRPWDAGVAGYLNELTVRKHCFQIKDTRLAIYVDDDSVQGY
jgi:predicted O-methyltransferase YrrM